jgi:hypothetical protein
MDTSYLKHLVNRIQIISVIEKASIFGGDLWQSHSVTEERILSQIIHINNEIKSDRVIFRTPSIIEVDPAKPIFIRLNYRNLIFRLEPGEFKVIGDRVSCRYPDQARALEERKGGDRYVLPFSAELSLSLKRMERNMREITHEMELRIIDVSEKGFGILISSANREYLKKNDHFWLKSIDHRLLRAPILGTVCYVAPKGYFLKRGDVRVGLSLSLPIARDVLETLKKKSVLVLSA